MLKLKEWMQSQSELIKFTSRLRLELVFIPKIKVLDLQ